MLSRIFQTLFGKKETVSEITLKNTYKDREQKKVREHNLILSNDPDTGLILFPRHPDETSDQSSADETRSKPNMRH